MNRQLRSGKERLVTVPVKRPYKKIKVGEPVVVVEIADVESMNKLILDETAEDEPPAKLPVVEPVVVLMAYLL